MDELLLVAVEEVLLLVVAGPGLLPLEADEGCEYGAVQECRPLPSAEDLIGDEWALFGGR